MTIPEDDTQDVRRSAEENARRAAAALAGAIEGFLDAIEDYDIGHEVEASVQEAGRVVRAVAEEGSNQAHTPEMRMVGEKLKAAGIATADKAGDIKDSVAYAAGSVKATASDVSGTLRDKVEDVKDAAYDLKENLRDIKDEVKVRAEAVGESARRARVAPKRVGHELKKAAGSWWHGLTTAMGMYAMLAVVAMTAWVVLTIALVSGLDRLLGDPLGTFVVFALYAIVAGICYAVAKSRRAHAAAETRRRMANSKEEIRRVGRPVKEAFAGRGRAGY